MGRTYFPTHAILTVVIGGILAMRTSHTKETLLRPDAKGRINLGKMAVGVSSFRAINLNELEKTPSFQKRLKAVRKALGYLEENPKHLSLHTHKYESLTKEFKVYSS